MLYVKQLTEHKYLEIELNKFSIKDTYSWFKFLIDFSTKRDHAGFQFSLDFLGFFGNIHIYDHRHWDYDRQDWNVI